MIRRIRYTKPTTGASIAACVIGAAVNAIYIFREITASGIEITAAASLLLGILGAYLTQKKMKSAAFCLVAASALPVLLNVSGVESLMPGIYGAFYAFASMNDFQLINLGTPMLESSDDVVNDMLSGKIMSDALSKQDKWLKLVNDFISRYTVFAYYGYMFASIACMFLHLARLFAPEMWEGYSREFWALLAAGGLTALAGFITETGRRKF